MKKSVTKLLAVLVTLTLVFAMFTGMSTTASAAEMKMPEGFEFIDGEVYSFREVLENVTIGLDHTAMDEVYFDGYQWNVTTCQTFTDGPWGIKDTWFARESTWEGFKCICASSSSGDNNSEIWKSHEMMIEWKEGDQNVYWSLQPLWSCSATTWINFVAPHTGKIVLFEEFGNNILALSEEAPYYSFEQKTNRPWKITIEKNDVKIWPMEEDCVVLDKNNREIAFPSLGKTGVMPVTEGDIISIRIDVAGEWEVGSDSSEYFGMSIGGTTTATFNPVVAYTEISEPVADVEDTYEDVDDVTAGNTDKKDDSAEEADADSNTLVLIIIIAAVAVVVVGAGVVAFVIIKKKKTVEKTSEE